MAASSSNPLFLTLTARGNGQRQDMRAAQAGQIIYKWKQQIQEAPADAVVQKVILGGHGYSRVAIVMITSYLKPLVSNVTAVDLSGIITDDNKDSEERVSGLSALCDVFRDCRLVEVNISANHLGRDKSVCKVYESVLGAQRKTIKHLFMKNMAWSVDNMTDVTHLLTRKQEEDDGTCICERLKTLHFHNEINDDGGAEQFRTILSASTQLVNVRYSGCRAFMEGSNALGAGFEKMGNKIATLQKLSLSGSSFGTGNGISLFATAMARCSKLTHLNLRNSGLGIKGTEQVCNALQQARVDLIELDLSQLKFGPQGAVPVVELLKTTTNTLRVLKCEDNKLTSLGVRRILKGLGLRHSPLEQLVLCRNECGHIGVDALIDATLPNLTLIDLNHNAFSWEDTKRLDNCFGNKLQKMDGNDNRRDVDAEHKLEGNDFDETDDFLSSISQAIGLVLDGVQCKGR